MKRKGPGLISIQILHCQIFTKVIIITTDKINPTEDNIAIVSTNGLHKNRCNNNE